MIYPAVSLPRVHKGPQEVAPCLVLLSFHAVSGAGRTDNDAEVTVLDLGEFDVAAVLDLGAKGMFEGLIHELELGGGGTCVDVFLVFLRFMSVW
jgi:hypothetical protein